MFVCDQCGLIFTRYHNLKRHTHTIHEQLKRSTCTVCSREMRNDKLKMHMRTVHEKGFLCEICGLTCTTRVALRKHINSHSTSGKLYLQ